MNVTFEITEKFQQIIEFAIEKAFAKISAQLGQTKPDDLFWSAKKAAKSVGVSEKTLWNYTQPRGPIPSHKIGSRTVYDPDELKAGIRSMQTRGGGHVED